MRKTFPFLLISAVLLCACTSPEQDLQIRLFWLQQYNRLMLQALGKKLKNAENNPQLNMALKQLQQLQTQQIFPEAQSEKNLNQAAYADSPAAAQPARKAKPAPQIMDVTLDTDILPGKASVEDRTRMKQALDEVQLANQSMLNDIASSFGDNVKYQAFLITADTERKLKQAASTSANFTVYSSTQQQLLEAQNKKLTSLMQQNVHNLKNIRR